MARTQDEIHELCSDASPSAEDCGAPREVGADFDSRLPTAFVALVIGLVAAAIAAPQAQVASAKLKLDLFDKRLKVFGAVWASLKALPSPSEADAARTGEAPIGLPTSTRSNSARAWQRSDLGRERCHRPIAPRGRAAVGDASRRAR